MHTATQRTRRRPPALLVRLAAAGALLLAAPSALADGPVPPPAAPAQEKPAEEKPRPTEFLANDLIRRPDGMIVCFYRVNYVSPENLKSELDNWKSPKGEIKASGVQFVGTAGRPAALPTSNILRILETEENWPVLQKVLAMWDVPQPQVRIEAKVLELTWDDQLKVGMTAKFSKPTGDAFLQSGDVKFPNTLDAINGTTLNFRSADKYVVFDYAMQLAEQGAKAEVKSEPSILASQGEMATLRAGDDEPYVMQNISGSTVTSQTTFKPVGIKLEVQPLLIGRDAVRVRIVAEASRVSDFRVTATSASQQVVNAVISTRNADTVVTIPNGETLVIGGLQQTSTRDTKTGIPLLKDIPVLGYLFGSTTARSTRSELFFLITLTIERPEEARLIVPPGERKRVQRDAENAPARSSND